MSDSPWSDAMAEIRRRVDAGRADGRYPEDLDEQLASQFARAAKDPLTFPALAALTRRVEGLRALTFGRNRIGLASTLPGGSKLHRIVGVMISRSISGVLQQVAELSRGTADALDSVVAALEEQRTVITNDLFGDIDAVHARLVTVEHRLARLEAAADSANGAEQT